jgi:hypothetical protein
VSAAAVRAQLAAHLLATGILTRESPEPVPFMRAAGRSPVHLEFGVAVESTGPSARRNDQSTSTVTVLIAYQLPPKDRISGYDGMLAVDDSIRAAVLASAWANGPRLAAYTWERTTRPPGIDGWIWIEQTYTAHHLT